MRYYYVYLLGSRLATLYVGVTNDLMRRMSEHRQGLVPGFTSKYNVKRLLYYETHNDVHAAIAREKQIKGWLRRRKWALIKTHNPEMRDLAEEWFRPIVKGRLMLGEGTSLRPPMAGSAQDDSQGADAAAPASETEQ